MRSVLLLFLCLMLSACQHWTLPGQDQTNDSQQAVGDSTGGLATPIPPLRLPFHFDDRSPSLSQWINYQLYVTNLPQARKEELWRHLAPSDPNDPNHYQRLMRVVLGLSYPAKRRLGEIEAALNELAEEQHLHPDSRRYAKQLLLWVEQLRHQEGEVLRLRRQLAQERTQKQELEEKIRKLSDIEETLNLRQRDR